MQFCQHYHNENHFCMKIYGIWISYFTNKFDSVDSLPTGVFIRNLILLSKCVYFLSENGRYLNFSLEKNLFIPNARIE